MGTAPLTRARGTFQIFSGYFGYKDAFWTVLDSYCCVVGDHSCQTPIMDTTLSDDNWYNWGHAAPLLPFDEVRVCVYQTILLFSDNVSKLIYKKLGIFSKSRDDNRL